jgi:hypothetical protein
MAMAKAFTPFCDPKIRRPAADNIQFSIAA